MKPLGLMAIAILLNINQIMACVVGGCKKTGIFSETTSLADGGIIGLLCCTPCAVQCLRDFHQIKEQIIARHGLL